MIKIKGNTNERVEKKSIRGKKVAEPSHVYIYWDWGKGLLIIKKIQTLKMLLLLNNLG